MSTIADLFKGQKCKQDFKIDWNGDVKQDFKKDFAYAAAVPVMVMAQTAYSFTSNTPGNAAQKGTIKPITIDSGAVAEVWTVTCTNATVPATFSVVGSVSGAKATARAAAAYDNGKIGFTIVAGSAAFEVNDVYSITVASIVQGSNIPVASFTVNPATGTFPLSVTFTDTSTQSPTSWAWTFSNGATSTVQNPTVVFADEGVYNVTLVATNANGSDPQVTNGAVVVKAPFVQPATQTTQVTPKPVVALLADVTTGTAPLTVHFTDNSTGNPTSWVWDFDDSDTSHVQNPVYTFTRPGTYDITLSVTGAGGSAIGTRTAYIVVH